MSYFFNPHVNFYFVIRIMFNLKSSLWIHFIFGIHPYFPIWFPINYIRTKIILKIYNINVEYDFALQVHKYVPKNYDYDY